MADVLVVDDDHSIRALVTLNLEMAAHRVATASNGRSALDMIAHRKPDIIVLDIMMPGLDGLTVATTIRNDADLDDIAIIYLTACATDDAIWDGWRTGVDSYICKPFDPATLVEEVARVWRGRRGHAGLTNPGDRHVIPRVDPTAFAQWFVPDRQPPARLRLSGASL